MKNQKYIKQGRAENQYCCPDKGTIQLTPVVYLKNEATFDSITANMPRQNISGYVSNGVRLLVKVNDQEIKATLYKHSGGRIILHHEFDINGFVLAQTYYKLEKLKGSDGGENLVSNEFISSGKMKEFTEAILPEMIFTEVKKHHQTLVHVFGDLLNKSCKMEAITMDPHIRNNVASFKYLEMALSKPLPKNTDPCTDQNVLDRLAQLSFASEVLDWPDHERAQVTYPDEKIPYVYHYNFMRVRGNRQIRGTLSEQRRAFSMYMKYRGLDSDQIRFEINYEENSIAGFSAFECESDIRRIFGHLAAETTRVAQYVLGGIDLPKIGTKERNRRIELLLHNGFKAPGYRAQLYDDLTKNNLSVDIVDYDRGLQEAVKRSGLFEQDKSERGHYFLIDRLLGNFSARSTK